MHIIDRYAYANCIRTVDPAQKTGLALAVLILCLVLNEPAVGLAATLWMWGLAVWVAGLSGKTFARVLFAQFLFFVLTTVGVAVGFSLSDPRPAASWAVAIGPLWLFGFPEGVHLASHLITRALGATAAMNFLALTTPLVDLMELFRRWHVPPLLIDLMTIIYRFIFVLLESLERMSMAQESRLGYHTTFCRAINNAALLGSRLFIDAFQRSQRLQTALESRGYEGGDLRVLPSQYRSDRNLWLLSAAVVLSLLLVWLVA